MYGSRILKKSEHSLNLDFLNVKKVLVITGNTKGESFFQYLFIRSELFNCFIFRVILDSLVELLFKNTIKKLKIVQN